MSKKITLVVKKEIDAEDLIAQMEEFIRSYPSNNENAKKLRERIPKMKVLEINQIRNAETQEPFVTWKDENGKSHIIHIKPSHFKVWGYLNSL